LKGFKEGILKNQWAKQEKKKNKGRAVGIKKKKGGAHNADAPPLE